MPVIAKVIETRICAAEMAVRHAALSRKVHVCHCNSLGDGRHMMLGNDNGTDGQISTDRRTDRQIDCDAICGPLLGRRAA